jgi:glycosyltransferase involved in cell wall biosynthesis
MIIHVYTICYNEEVLLPYFFRHYRQFARKIVVYDNGSSDKSIEIVKANGGELRTLDTGGKLSNRALQTTKNTCYLDSRGKAHWVIVVDVDELLYHQKLVDILRGYMASGITIPKTEGFDMVSGAPPSGGGQIVDEIKDGYPSALYNKCAIFRPTIDINFGIGAHHASPRGPVKFSESADIKLLHYRYLGVEFMTKRIVARMERMCLEDIINGWGSVTPTEGLTLTEFMKKCYASDMEKCRPSIRRVL